LHWGQHVWMGEKRVEGLVVDGQRGIFLKEEDDGLRKRLESCYLEDENEKENGNEIGKKEEE